MENRPAATLVRLKAQAWIHTLRGQLLWAGYLDALRRERLADELTPEPSAGELSEGLHVDR